MIAKLDAPQAMLRLIAKGRDHELGEEIIYQNGARSTKEGISYSFSYRFRRRNVRLAKRII